MRRLIEIWVPGHPKTKGSLRFLGPNQVEEVVKNGPWRTKVVEAARASQPTKAPVHVQVVYWLEPPQGWVERVTAWFWAAIWHQAGDTDKLARLILDALQDAGVYENDNQVTVLVSIKFPSNGEPGDSGALILVNELEHPDEQRSWHEEIRARVRGY